MRESLRKNKTGIILMLFSSIFVCIGQLFWKLSSARGFGYIIVGFALYGMGALIMILAYRYGSLSVLQPMLSLNYVLSIILASAVLGENITAIKICGVLVIIAGVICISLGDE